MQFLLGAPESNLCVVPGRSLLKLISRFLASFSLKLQNQEPRKLPEKGAEKNKKEHCSIMFNMEGEQMTIHASGIEAASAQIMPW